MKKLLVILALGLMSCDDKGAIGSRPAQYMNHTHLGALPGCIDVLSFEDGPNKCYIVHYCGSSNDTISCVKNEVAPTK